MSPDEARVELLPILGSSTLINMLLDAWAAAIGQPAFVTSTFAALTGAAPRTFGEWATDYAAEFLASTATRKRLCVRSRVVAKGTGAGDVTQKIMTSRSNAQDRDRAHRQRP